MELRTFDPAPLGTGPWAAPLRVPVAEPPARCDVAIVGAGLTGLSAALLLAERRVAVVVVDRDFGHGATSRSGGIVLGDTVEGPAPGFDGCERQLGEWIVHEEVACEFRWASCLELTRDPQATASPINWQDAGPVRASRTVPAGLLDPVQLLNGLLWKCRRAGVIVVIGFEVDRVAADETTVVFTSGSRDLAAAAGIMATDAVAWRANADPWPKRTLTVALQTTVMPSDTTIVLGLRPHQPFYTNELPLLWGRPLPDGSYIFGRELVTFPWHTPVDEVRRLVTTAGERLAVRVHELHPRLSDAKVQRIWAGPTARSVDGVPRVVADPEVPAIVWAGGYGGHGLAQAFTVGRRAAMYVLQRLDSSGFSLPASGFRFQA
jgi:glycine/D-amino acid oxidase-like deaminating enzyme